MSEKMKGGIIGCLIALVIMLSISMSKIAQIDQRLKAVERINEVQNGIILLNKE